jgi:hypothetical protein
MIAALSLPEYAGLLAAAFSIGIFAVVALFRKL